MRQPISFVYRNLVFGETLDDAWAVYRLATSAYAGLTRAGKRERLSELAGFAYAIDADFSLLRVARPWSLDEYVAGVRATTDSRHAHHDELDAYLAGQGEQLAGRSSHLPEVFLSVRLTRERVFGSTVLPFMPALDTARRLLGLSDPRTISTKRLDELLDEEGKVFGRVLDYVESDRATSGEIQWLVKRAFCRSLADPVIDERFLPQALIAEAPDPSDSARFRPLEADVLRLLDAPITIEPRSLRVESEAGESHQAFLCLGALPESAPFPGRRTELLYAPLEAVDFPVDAAFSARLVRNEEAARLVRRRVVDADNIYREESGGDHGPSASAAERPSVARELEEYLGGGDHPPLLLSGISLAVSAPSREELEDRIERLRREYGAVKLHRPLGDQLRLFITHLPGQPSRVPQYDDYLTVEQFGAMVPTATHAVGSEAGPYVGQTLTGARQPVLFDPTEACRTSRPPATLFAGTLGSGKTLAMELIMYQAFLAGSTICDIDPKGDHALERLPGVAEQMETIELSGDARYHGMLDPLRVAPDDTREDLTCNFLFAILPEPIAPEWRTEIRRAVQMVAGSERASCGAVIEELERGADTARDAARALNVHAGSGLARLGFATAGSEAPRAGSKQVTSLRIRNLVLPLPGTPRSELLEEERIGQALLHLLAVYALRLTSSDHERHSILGFDEAWVLLGDGGGRALVDRISRLGRANNVTPLLATQMVGDVDDLENLIGACFCFGVESEEEARNALRLLHLDEDDGELRQRLMSFRRGRCLMRDYGGRVGPVQVDLVDPRLLSALDTTPRAQPEIVLDPAELPAAG